MELITCNNVVIQFTIDKPPTEKFTNEEIMAIQSLLIKTIARLETFGNVTGMIGVMNGEEHDIPIVSEDRPNTDKAN